MLKHRCAIYGLDVAVLSNDAKYWQTNIELGVLPPTIARDCKLLEFLGGSGNNWSVKTDLALHDLAASCPGHVLGDTPVSICNRNIKCQPWSFRESHIQSNSSVHQPKKLWFHSDGWASLWGALPSSEDRDLPVLTNLETHTAEACAEWPHLQQIKNAKLRVDILEICTPLWQDMKE